jgi:ribosomal protein S18 acetylase RimI-like enzyme
MLDFGGSTQGFCARDMHVDRARLESALGDLGVVPAAGDQARSVSKLRDDLARWMLNHGIEQWRPRDLTLEGVQECVSQGWIFVAQRDEQLVGSVTIVWQDPLIWGERREPAGYIHMLMVDRRFAGHRVGRALLDWAERYILHSGRDLARLDCAKDNGVLRAYYEGAGYQLVGYKVFPEIESALETALYEKPLEA